MIDNIADLQKLLSEKESDVVSLQSLMTRDKETHVLKVRVQEHSERDEREKETLKRALRK